MPTKRMASKPVLQMRLLHVSLVFPGQPRDLIHCMDTASWEPLSFRSADVQHTCTVPGASQKCPGVQDVHCWAKLSISMENRRAELYPTSSSFKLVCVSKPVYPQQLEVRELSALKCDSDCDWISGW